MALAPRIPRAVPGKSVAKAEAKKTREAKEHLKFVRTLPCCATGKPGPSDPHHLMRGADRDGGRKSSGRYTIPLCRKVHDEITPHGDPEAVLMERYGVDARALADALWAVTGDPLAMHRAVLRAWWEACRRMKP